MRPSTGGGYVVFTDVLQFYFAMFLVYSLLAIAWGWLCWQNVQDLLPIQVGYMPRFAMPSSHFRSITSPVYLAS